MIALEDFKRLSVEIEARNINIKSWAEENGVDNDTLTELGESFMVILNQRILIQVEEVASNTDQTSGFLDPTPALIGAMLQTFIYGWEACVQYGKRPQDVIYDAKEGRET